MSRQRFLKITKHARQRIRERLPLSENEIISLFRQAMPYPEKESIDGEEYFEANGFIFVARRGFGGRVYRLITLYKNERV